MNVRGSEQEPEADAERGQTLDLATHAYRLGRRIEIARQWTLDGQPPAISRSASAFAINPTSPDTSSATSNDARALRREAESRAGLRFLPQGLAEPVADRRAEAAREDASI